MAEPVIFKGRSGHLEMLLSPSYGFDAIKSAIRDKIDANRRFFEGVNAHVSVEGALSDVEREELAGMLENDYSISLDFTPLPAPVNPPPTRSKSAAPASEAPKAAPSAVKSVKLRKSESTLFVQETLRSGRRVCFDGDIVILGDVNNGAEVVASGSIVIMGALRGLAHAGAQGDESAIISAFSMRAKQFRIAAHIAISADGEAESGLPEVAKVSGDRIELVSYRAR